MSHNSTRALRVATISVAVVALLCLPGGVGGVEGGAVQAPAGGDQPAPTSTSRPVDRAETGDGRAMLGRIALGFLVATAGATALAVTLQYWGPAGLTLVAFGSFSLLYGIRILISTQPIGEMLGVSRRTLTYTVVWINYLLPVLGLLYAEQIRGRGWYSLLRRFWQAGLVLAPSFIIYDLLAGAPLASWPVYRMFLLAAMLVLLPHAIWWRQRDPVESTVRTIGTTVLVLAVLHDNLINFAPWRVSLEVYGIGVFILALGFVTTRRFLADQRELATVEHELEMARTIQTSILPRQLPTLRGARIAVRYLPARAVAGDVYDFIATDGQRIGVLVADVAGHGVSAALIASMTTVAFSGQRRYADDPSRTLSEINRVLCEHTDGRFTTAVYAFLDLEEHLLRYSLAGHPPPFLWRAKTGELLELAEGATVLGLFEDTGFPTTELPLDAGDRLILYTDGIPDVSRRNGEWFGEHEWKRFIMENGALATDLFIDALFAHLRRWSGIGVDGHFEDDLTIVVIDVDPQPET
jgi:sigma-B regulation protein RsbU (phosphoserine phosphatase)